MGVNNGKHPSVLMCPRCRCSKQDELRRGHLYNRSTFLPQNQRDKKKLQRVTLHCLHCGYNWRSESNPAGLSEISADEQADLITTDNPE